jgi:ribokinase
MASQPGQPVVVFGSANWDHTVFVEHLPVPGETVLGSAYLAAPGGKGLNQAVSAARQGAQVTVVCCIGDDPPGRRLLEALDHEGISTEGARLVEGTPSGTALITVAKGGTNTIVVARGANSLLSRADVEAAASYLVPGGAVLAQLEVPEATVELALCLAKSRGLVTVLNPSPVPSALPGSFAGSVDVLVANAGEAAALSGCGEPEEAARKLCQEGWRAVVVTLGEKGALVLERGRELLRVPSFEVEAVDTTAAGDAFCGALTAALAEGEHLEGAARRGCAAGALAATVMGALPSLPRREAVLALLASRR